MAVVVAAFLGFQTELVEFLANLRANNSREWFQAHRAEYEHLKTPYKTHLDLWFWQGGAPGSSRERPGYFFRLTPESLILGAGMHAFPDAALTHYRHAVLDGARGAALEQAVQQCDATIGGRTYKRVPAGVPSDHARADWLRHSGLFAELQFEPVPPQVFSADLPDWCVQHYQRVAPLQRWLVELLSST